MNRGTNPALLGMSSRGFVELGVSPEAGAGNNYFSIGDIFTPTIMIDLRAIQEDLGKSDFRLASTVSGDAHLVARILGVSLGFYTNLDGALSAGAPSSLFEILGSGNPSGEEINASSPIAGRVFAEAGVNAGVPIGDNWYVGGSLGVFAPVFFTDRGSSVDFSFATYEPGDEKPDGTISEGEVSATASMDLRAYSAFNFEQPNVSSPGEMLALLNGVKVDLGVVRIENSKALYGANLSGIPIVAATADNAVTLSASATVTQENLLGNFDQEDADYLTQEVMDVTPTYETCVGQSIFMPFQLGGFYRFGLPVVDIIGHGQLHFMDPFQMTAGAIVEGNFFPLNMLSLGVEWDRVAWRTTLGLRADLRALELGVDVGMTAPNPLHLFSAQGLWAKAYVAMGF
ncbi:MAG: hypothetical protein ACLFUA_09465 [Spirochaetales bacterium]